MVDALHQLWHSTMAVVVAASYYVLIHCTNALALAEGSSSFYFSFQGPLHPYFHHQLRTSITTKSGFDPETLDRGGPVPYNCHGVGLVSSISDGHGVGVAGKIIGHDAGHIGGIVGL
ncbi:hypothetical protein GOP47_0014808 [Adiantum capillus-veneris]|uniref:Uncharacterized protein n=1 Tax=Adiantum capillus-veneris TaxID=13818 RepID=A0A9D4ZEK8_ADICA|nr:hypothetical protein GOP47_0014808 [Adiantum capillus-veneris]